MAPLIELIKDKDYAMKVAKKRGDPNLWAEAKRLRNICTNRLRKARADYIKENLENNFGNCEKFWKNIQTVLPNKKNNLQATSICMIIPTIRTSAMTKLPIILIISW